jgi:hypothetical protein
MISPLEPIRHWWDYYRERPFWRLVQLFVERIFRGGGDSDAEGLDLGVGLVLTLLAMPGGFVSLLLLNKYGTFLQWLRGLPSADVLLVSFPDEYFFIVLSMTVTGAVAVWRWDSIFPDRRDYGNLVHLPLSMRTIFSANLVAVVYLVVLVACDVNAVSAVLFPAVVAATQVQFLFFVKFAILHTVVVLLASVLSFFGVFSALGLLMTILPPHTFRRASAYFRGVVVVYLVMLLCTSFAVPDLLRRIKGPLPAWTFFMPSCWFISLCQVVRDRANPAMAELARLALPATAAIIAAALVLYALAYRRHFVRIPEIADVGPAARGSTTGPLRDLLDKTLLRTPFQRGCFGFVTKTLLRSEAHLLVLTGVGGLSLVLASQALLSAYEGGSSGRAAALSPDALSIPFIITFLMIIGLRVVFEVPAELRANWIFQLTLDPDGRECSPLAMRVLLISVLPITLIVMFPIYIYLAGVKIAALHTIVVAHWTTCLANLLLIRFRKLPFTCTIPVFKQHSIVILISFCFGYLIYAVSTPEFESSALTEPWRLLGLLPVAALAWFIPHQLSSSANDLERKLIFEETATRTVELLRLSD